MNIVRQEPNACAALYYEFFRDLWRPVTGCFFVFAIYFLTLKANDAGPGQMDREVALRSFPQPTA